MKSNVKMPLMAFAFTGMALSSIAQTSVKESVPNGWHLKDQKTSGYYGISLDNAYNFVKGKKGQTVVVAVIDSGIDTLHEDLKNILWVNPKEIPGNGIDDDRNGYVDDVHGWNFLGGRDGRNVSKDSYEGARVYHGLKARFENVTDPSTLSKADQELYATWLRAKQSVVSDVDMNEIAQMKLIYPNFLKGDSVIRKELGKEEYNGEDLKNYTPKDPYAIGTSRIIMNISKAYNKYDISNTDLINDFDSQISKAESATTAPPDYRGMIVKDNENDINDRFYGNNDIMATDADHGTHVAGIIAASRGNGKGVDGVADNVRIMMIRAVPNGDEHDKDIALAIRYAVDNGARVINMSFGKSFSPQKQWVDEATKYAESKGVLLVHAAGNDHKDIDTEYNFPSAKYLDGGQPTNWVTVGATGDPKNGGLVANFSNYGKTNVDVFAPGVNIYSTVPGGNKYKNFSGTSMASPVVAGLAAFLLTYYPQLTPQQVKSVLQKSAVKPSIKATKPGSETQVELSELSATGGIVNAYEAIRMADAMAKDKQTLPKKIKVKEKKRA